MILRIYKTHDHDLMGLHQTGTLDIAKAAKAAVLAYFKGERFRFDLKPGQYPDSKAMPSVAAFQIEFDDELDEAPGIRKWLQCFLLPVIMGMASALLALIRNDMRELQRPCRRKEEVIQSRWKQGTYKREGTERRGRI